MRTVLNIKSDTADARAEAVIAAQRSQAHLQTDVVDLRTGEVDYHALLDKIFAADAVAVW